MLERRILVVDDEEGILEVIQDTLCSIPDCHLDVELSAEAAAKRLSKDSYDLLISDIKMSGMGGVELLQLAKQTDPEITVMMLTAFPTVETAVECMKLGAADYLNKPFVPEDLSATVKRLLQARHLEQENRVLGRQLERKWVFDDILGRSRPMQKVFDTIERVASTDVDVLIIGETGTGKELIARSIHRRSNRSSKRFVPVDCGAIPENLMESELFGHERGAFTGATQRSMGLMELAEGGTFFLDEIAEMPHALQSKLLRVLQERRCRRVGGKSEIPIDVRIVAATNRDLVREQAEGRFREDLYYRIHVVQINLPALRERSEDIPILVDHFVRRYAKEMGKTGITVAPDVLEALCLYSWPGNIRQLQNALKRAIALVRRDRLEVDDLPEEIFVPPTTASSSTSNSEGFFEQRSMHVNAFERSFLIRLLERCGGDVTKAAQAAALPRGTAYRLLKKHEIVPDDYRA